VDDDCFYNSTRSTWSPGRLLKLPPVRVKKVRVHKSGVYRLLLKPSSLPIIILTSRSRHELSHYHNQLTRDNNTQT
jgi:hypothetical protein